MKPHTTELSSTDFEILVKAHKKVHDHRTKVSISKRGNRWLNTPAGRVIAQPRPSGVASQKLWKRSYIGIGRNIVGTMITDADGEIKFVTPQEGRK